MTSRTTRTPLSARARIAALALLVAPASVTGTLAGSVATAAPAHAKPQITEPVPAVVAHRGASGYRPEHTLAAYELAIGMGADYIEPDVVSTKDGVLVARHENEIGGTTDVEAHPEFADRRTTKIIDGVPITGWFTEDFTLAELKTLRAEERLPQVRPDNTRYNGQFQIPTFAEVLALAKAKSKELGRTIGVQPETKHPTYFDSIGLSLEEPLLADLRAAKMDKKKSPVVIQSFEVSNLKELAPKTDVQISQLLDASGAPYDQVAAGTGVTYASMATPTGFAEIAEYADWAGPNKNLVLPRDPVTKAVGEPSEVVDDAHAAGLKVVVWTLRDENQFMASNFWIGTDPNAKGDIEAEVHAFLDAGVDALFADHPDSALAARSTWLAAR